MVPSSSYNVDLETVNESENVSDLVMSNSLWPHEL